MNRRIPFRLAGALIFALIAASVASAAGSNGPPAPGSVPVKPSTATATRSEAQIRAYWTPARMAAAREFEMQDSRSLATTTNLGPAFKGMRGSPRTTGRPPAVMVPQVRKARRHPSELNRTTGIVQSRSAVGEPNYGGPYSLPYYGWGYLAGNQYIPAVGRLYYKNGSGSGLDGACTGTLVAANIVVTAAHCVVDLNGNYNSNFLFAPAQIGGNAPYGVYAWRTATLWQYYYTVRDPDAPQLGFGPMDYAFIVLNSNPGITPWPMLFNSPGGDIFHMGYPASPTVQGDWSSYCPFPLRSTTDLTCFIWYCHAPVGAYDQDYQGWWEVGIGCATSGGASGGPWFQAYGGNWYVASVMSTVTFSPPNAWGPYFNDFGPNSLSTRGLFDYARSL